MLDEPMPGYMYMRETTFPEMILVCNKQAGVFKCIDCEFNKSPICAAKRSARVMVNKLRALC